MSEVVASQVSVGDLKTHLSEWLARAQSGEVVGVTSHRQPIARITAMKPATSVSTNPLRKAIDAGVISWNGQNPVIPPPVKLNDGGPLMSESMIEARSSSEGIAVCRITWAETMAALAQRSRFKGAC